MDPTARDLQVRVSHLKFELEQAESRLRILQDNCEHQWSEPQYTPLVREAYRTQNLYGHFTKNADGTINAPEVTVPREETPRWTRTCSRCGRAETTAHVVEHVTREPRF